MIYDITYIMIFPYDIHMTSPHVWPPRPVRRLVSAAPPRGVEPRERAAPICSWVVDPWGNFPWGKPMGKTMGRTTTLLRKRKNLEMYFLDVKIDWCWKHLKTACWFQHVFEANETGRNISEQRCTGQTGGLSTGPTAYLHALAAAWTSGQTGLNWLTTNSIQKLAVHLGQQYLYGDFHVGSRVALVIIQIFIGRSFGSTIFCWQNWQEYSQVPGPTDSSSLWTRMDTCAMTSLKSSLFGGSGQQALFLTLRVLNTCSKLFSTILRRCFRWTLCLHSEL